MRKLSILLIPMLVFVGFSFGYQKTKSDQEIIDFISEKFVNLSEERLESVSGKIDSFLGNSSILKKPRVHYILSEIQDSITLALLKRSHDKELIKDKILSPEDQALVLYNKEYDKNQSVMTHSKKNLYASTSEQSEAYECIENNNKFNDFMFGDSYDFISRTEFVFALIEYIKTDSSLQQRFPKDWTCELLDISDLYEKQKIHAMCEMGFIKAYDGYFFPDEKVNLMEAFDSFESILQVSDIGSLLGNGFSNNIDLSSYLTLHDLKILLYRLRVYGFCEGKLTNSGEATDVILQKLFGT